MITRELIHAILSEYTLPVMGTHGVPHWARVLDIGRRLCAETDASEDVVTLFSVFHDSKRVNESHDPGHGARGADLARRLRGTMFDLPDREFDQLVFACTHHTDGAVDADPTIGACWDSDRLDLGRLWYEIRVDRLSVEPAKDPDFIAWASERGGRGFVPSYVRDEWHVIG